VVKVKVLSVDRERKRIALSIKEAEPGGDRQVQKGGPAREKKPAPAPELSWEKAGFRVKKR
jgi:uncharacterized protein